jgi:hypothetical protein
LSRKLLITSPTYHNMIQISRIGVLQAEALVLGRSAPLPGLRHVEPPP